MKRSLVFALIFVLGSAFADPNSMVLTQRNSADTGNQLRVLSAPASKGLFIYDPAAQLPSYVTLGSGMSFSGGMLVMTTAPVNADWNAVSGLAQILNKPSIPASQVNSDWVASSGISQILNRPTLATVATSGSYVDLSSKPTLATVAATGAYADLTGKPTIPTITAFNFSQPSARSLALSTSLQATDTTKAAVLYPSYACTNATTVLAASGCTMQVRVSSSAVTCSTGTIYYTQSLTVTLGVLLTQASTNPVPIYLPIGGFFILCPTTGTFTVSAVEQSAG